MMEQYIDYVFVGAVAVALIGYFVVLRKLAKTRNNKSSEDNPSTPPLFSNFDESTLKAEVETGNPTSFDDLLSQTVKSSFKSGDLEVRPSVKLTHEGEYEVLGKEWKGKVHLRIRPKQAKREEETPPKQKTLEEYTREEEESLF